MLKNIQRQYLFATMNKLINALYVFGFQAIGFQLAISDCKVFDFKIRNECCFFSFLMLHIWTLYDLLMNCVLNIQIYF